jgi:hypothetical protein
MQTAVFWGVLCWLVVRYQHFGDISCLSLEGPVCNVLTGRQFLQQHWFLYAVHSASHVTVTSKIKDFIAPALLLHITCGPEFSESNFSKLLLPLKIVITSVCPDVVYYYIFPYI